MHWSLIRDSILPPNLLADLSRTKRSQRPAQIPATGHAMKKRRTAQRTAKMGLPEDMVYWFVGLLLLLIDGMLGSWSWGEDFERKSPKNTRGGRAHISSPRLACDLFCPFINT